MKVRLLLLTTLFPLIFVSTYAWAQVVTDGLVSYWTFDQNTIVGNTVEDVWGDNDRTFVGAPAVAAGKFGGGLKFDGVDDGVDCGNDLNTFMEFDKVIISIRREKLCLQVTHQKKTK